MLSAGEVRRGAVGIVLDLHELQRLVHARTHVAIGNGRRRNARETPRFEHRHVRRG